MAVEDWVKVVGVPFPKVERVTRQMVEAVAGQSLLTRGSVRLMTGRISTTDEIEQRREEGKKPLIG
jgi:hypothetical protein